MRKLLLAVPFLFLSVSTLAVECPEISEVRETLKASMNRDEISTTFHSAMKSNLRAPDDEAKGISNAGFFLRFLDVLKLEKSEAVSRGRVYTTCKYYVGDDVAEGAVSAVIIDHK